MEDQGKILIGIFSGLMGIGVVIGLSILGLRKKEKNRKDEVWNEWQKDTLFNDKVLEMKEQVDNAAKQVNEISKQVDKLKISGERQDKILTRLVAKEEEAKRLKDEGNKEERETLQKMYNESVLPQIAKMTKQIAKIEEGHKETRADLEAYDKLVTQGVKDLQGAGEAFKVLRRMKEEDKEIEDETDPDVKDAMISAQLEELRDLRNGLVGDCNNDELNKPSNVLIPNTPGQEI